MELAANDANNLIESELTDVEEILREGFKKVIIITFGGRWVIYHFFLFGLKMILSNSRP